MCHHPDKVGMMDIETNIKVIIKQILNQKQEEKFKEILNDAPYGRIEMQGRQHRQRNSGSR